jgi:ATP-dependent DNA helicase RecG
MRPEALNPLFTDITALKGVGPKVAALISKVAGPRIVDLIFTLPTGVIDRSYRPKVMEAVEGELATMLVSVEAHQPPPKGVSRLPYKVLCSDDTGYITLAFFHARADYLQKQLPEGATRLVSGKVESWSGGRQMVHPDYMIDPEGDEDLPLMEPVYPLTASLSSKVMRKAVSGAVERIPDLEEWLRDDLLAREKWPAWHAALMQMHAPDSKLDLAEDSVARKRLAYDELLSNQLALALIRQQRAAKPGRAFKGDGALRQQVESTLPFALTGDQQQVLKEIYDDMAAPARMVRLVQGDVGAGKTVVALLAMLNIVETGAQAVLMAPTEILARQHYEGIAPLLAQSNIVVELLTGRDKGKQREAKLSGLAKGYINILIGTHALFSDDVQYKDLGLVVVDEQHRFGVFQRLALQEKGHVPDVLVMTATPIPRTLALTTYGDMDVSQIKEKPPGRKPVDTRTIPLEKVDEVMQGIARAVSKGEQVYWVCPLVEDSDMIDLTSVESRYASLQAVCGDIVGLVHGKMKSEEKDRVVDAFYTGEIKVLVATTVIEVGVNAPAATIMVIEHAERFGLAQLHQLRGRVGRGDKQSTCLLLYKTNDSGKLGDTAKARLKILRDTEDGFLIAEEDLRLRGSGDALGSAQSGFPQFRLADATRDSSLLEMARDDARMIVDEDAKLQSSRGEALRHLLYLFGRDDAVKLLRSG